MKISPTQHERQSGFTIIETLVAITILMVAIAGPLTVASKALTASIYARDQMVASYLAQDALEYIKNVRSNYKLSNNGNPWLTLFNGCVSACTIDTVRGGVIVPKSGNNDQLYLTTTSGLSTNGIYSHSNNSGDVPTQFYRSFTVIPSGSNPQEAEITVTVNWQTGTVSNSVILHNTIYDVFQ